jgi:hypothetical protein
MSKFLLTLYCTTILLAISARIGSTRTVVSDVNPTIEMIQSEGLACYAMATSISGLNILKGIISPLFLSFFERFHRHCQIRLSAVSNQHTASNFISQFNLAILSDFYIEYKSTLVLFANN